MRFPRQSVDDMLLLCRLVVLLETRAIVSEIENLQKLRVIETPPNPEVWFVREWVAIQWMM